VRFLRLLVLVLAIASVYIAQYIFLHQSLQNFFPQKLLDFLPLLTRFTRWLPEDLFRAALWSSGLALLAVGLVTSAWRGGDAPLPVAVLAAGQARRVGAATLLITLALLIATANCIFLWLTGSENMVVQIGWVGTLALFFAGQIWLGSAIVTDDSTNDVTGEAAKPAAEVVLLQSWRPLLVILFCAGILFGWQLTTTPTPLRDDVAQIGLKALALAQGANAQFFVHAQTAFPDLALMPAALAIWLSGDALLGVRLVGLSAGLLLIIATWLLGSELFQRMPIYGEYGEVIEDAGQWPTLVATALMAVNVVMIVFSRLPVYLEPVVWGTFGLWAWLRGIRQRNRLSLALSGVLIGLALILYQNGSLFLLIMPLWWLGYRLLHPVWRKKATPRVTRPAVRWPALIWLGGIWVASAPLIGIWLRAPELLFGRAQGMLWGNLAQLPATFQLAVLPTGKLTYPFAGVSIIAAPLLILAVGCLLLNLDQLTGWLLATWLGLMLIGSSLMLTQSTDWPVLLPLLPGLALALAFTLDRLRTTLMETAGTWLIQATTYLAVGLILWTGQASWIEYKQFLRSHTTDADYLGFVLRELATTSRPIVFVQPDNAPLAMVQLPVRFLTNDGTLANHLQVVAPGAMPATLPPHAIALWQGEEAPLLQDLQSHYPGGTLHIERDALANPIAFLYVLP
jgi:hypothetical protein